MTPQNLPVFEMRGDHLQPKNKQICSSFFALLFTTMLNFNDLWFFNFKQSLIQFSQIKYFLVINTRAQNVYSILVPISLNL
jgi:hypothetical protein